MHVCKYCLVLRFSSSPHEHHRTMTQNPKKRSFSVSRLVMRLVCDLMPSCMKCARHPKTRPRRPAYNQGHAQVGSSQVGTPFEPPCKALRTTTRLYEAYISLLEGYPRHIYPHETVLDTRTIKTVLLTWQGSRSEAGDVGPVEDERWGVPESVDVALPAVITGLLLRNLN